MPHSDEWFVTTVYLRSAGAPYINLYGPFTNAKARRVRSEFVSEVADRGVPDGRFFVKVHRAFDDVVRISPSA